MDTQNIPKWWVGKCISFQILYGYFDLCWVDLTWISRWSPCSQGFLQISLLKSAACARWYCKKQKLPSVTCQIGCLPTQALGGVQVMLLWYDLISWGRLDFQGFFTVTQMVCICHAGGFLLFSWIDNPTRFAIILWVPFLTSVELASFGWLTYQYPSSCILMARLTYLKALNFLPLLTFANVFLLGYAPFLFFKRYKKNPT